MSFSFQSQDLLHAWVWSMIHSVWIGLVLAFMYYTYLSMNIHTKAKSKYAVGMALFLLLPIGSLVAFIMSMPVHLDTQTQTIISSSNSDGIMANRILDQSAGIGYSFGQNINQYIPSIFLVWCLGVVLLCLRMIVGYREITSLRKKASLINNIELKLLFDQLMEKSGIKKNIQLATSSKIEMPITLGHLKPIILLPISIVNQLSHEETYAILAHELAHIMRRDYLQNLFISMTEILFFFHPSVWWFASTIKSIREQCCDDIAISLDAERIALSKALISLEDCHSAPIFAMAFSHKNQLLHRIQRLFDVKTTNEFTMSRSQAPVLICSIALLWIFTSAWQPTSEFLSRANNLIPISNSFLWDPKTSADTTKPKSKIEKITKDNGKQKLELQLEDKKIKELKIDDNVISPDEYEKYKTETEALTKELKEIEMPEIKARAKVYSDMDDEDSRFRYHYNFDRDTNKIVGSELRNYNDNKYDRSNNGNRNKSRSFSWSDDRPRAYSWSGDDVIKLKNKLHAFRSGDGDKIKYIIEGDSTGLIINGDQLIMKNDKGDVIINFGGRDGLHWSWSGSPMVDFPSEHFDMKGFGEEFSKKFKEKEWLNLERNDELNRKLKSHIDKSMDKLKELNELRGLEDLRGKKWDDEKFHDKMKSDLKKSLKNKEWDDDDQIMRLKELKERDHKIFKDEWGDRKFFKDGEGFNLLSGKGKLDQIIQEHLVDDHIIKPGEKYEFKISNLELKVNGKKQSDKFYKEYKSIVEDATGIEMKGNTNFVFSGSGKKD